MEISARFSPKSCFFSGDLVRCLIEFRVPEAGGAEAPGRPVCLAWASAQIQCECVTAEDAGGAAGAGSAQKKRLTHHHTSFRPVDWLEGSQIMSSSPKVLFCEAAVEPGEAKVVSYCERLPPDLPPSHRGKKIKINYNLLVGTQAPGSAVSVLKLPFRVLNVPGTGGGPGTSSSGSGVPNGLGVLGGGNQHHHGNGLNGDPVPIASSPFLRESWSSRDSPTPSPGGYGTTNGTSASAPASMSNFVLQPVKKQVNYDINTSAGCLAKLCMSRNQFKLGEEVVASVRFPATSPVRCVQYSAGLVYTETVRLSDEKADSCQTVAAKHHDFTYGLEECHLSLEVPHAVTPTFRAASCQLEWHLHFEFVTTPASASDGGSDADPAADASATDPEWNAPRTVNVQTLEWDLPVTILPADPALLGWVQAWGSAGGAQKKRSMKMDASNASSSSTTAA